MSRRQLSDGMGYAFAMVPLEPNGLMITALREGRLQARDAATLQALLAHLDWRSGRCWLSIAGLADASGRSWHSTQQSLGRLRREGLVARGTDKRNPSLRFWCIHPGVAVTGGALRRERCLQQFLDSLA